MFEDYYSFYLVNVTSLLSSVINDRTQWRCSTVWYSQGTFIVPITLKVLSKINWSVRPHILITAAEALYNTSECSHSFCYFDVKSLKPQKLKANKHKNWQEFSNIITLSFILINISTICIPPFNSLSFCHCQCGLLCLFVSFKKFRHSNNLCWKLHLRQWPTL